jgi:anaerobic selenocysteine-containing dehydrogenase
MPFTYRKYEKGMLRPDGKLGFMTSTGRIELWSTFYNQAGLDPLPYFEEPSPGPGATPEMLEEYPLVMTTGARAWSLFHSEHRQVARMRAMHPEPTVQCNPKVLERFGLKDGDWVWIENFLGRAKSRCVATPIYDERIIGCDHAWWYPESDPEKLYNVFDLNINNLVPWISGKSGFGSNYKTTLVKLYKVEEGE